MAYDALTIDTQTVYGNNNKLMTGIIGQLSQYKDGPVQFVISEIVLREIYKVRRNIAQGVIKKQKTALRDGTKNGLIAQTEDSRRIDQVFRAWVTRCSSDCECVLLLDR